MYRFFLAMFLVIFLFPPKAKSNPIVGVAFCVGPQVIACAAIGAITAGVFAWSINGNEAILFFDSNEGLDEFEDEMSKMAKAEDLTGLEIYDVGKGSGPIDIYGDPLFPEDEKAFNQARKKQGVGGNRVIGLEQKAVVNKHNDSGIRKLHALAEIQGDAINRIKFHSMPIPEEECQNLKAQVLAVGVIRGFKPICYYLSHFPKLRLGQEQEVDEQTMIQFTRQSGQMGCYEDNSN